MMVGIFEAPEIVSWAGNLPPCHKDLQKANSFMSTSAYFVTPFIPGI